MSDLIIGCLAFGLLYIFDYNKIEARIQWLNSFFGIGVIILAYSSWQVIFSPSAGFSVSAEISAVFYGLAGISALFMLYALFGALPFKKTYVEGASTELIDTGVYALCRHPGVWGFFFMYMFAFLASGKWIVLAACICWTMMDIIHVWVQDRYFFPKTLPGYQQYQQTTPFLFFTRESFTRFIQTIGSRGKL